MLVQLASQLFRYLRHRIVELKASMKDQMGAFQGGGRLRILRGFSRGGRSLGDRGCKFIKIWISPLSLLTKSTIIQFRYISNLKIITF